MAVRMSKTPKRSKEKIIELTDKLGYTVTLNGSAIYLIKDGVKIYYKSYYKLYGYLYSKLRKQSV